MAKYLDPRCLSDPRADERELEEVMDRLRPGWRSKVVAKRYLLAMTLTHAIPTADRGGVRGRPSCQVRELPGLYLARDWVGGQGQLAAASVMSAAEAARLIAAVGRRPAAPAGARA